MSVSHNTTLQDQLDDLLSYIREGRILDAMNEFYAEGVVMQENNVSPTVGREANLERERQFLSTVKEWKRFDVIAKGAGEDVTFYEAIMEWTTIDGAAVHVEQVVVAKWLNGQIISERFYHNP